VSALPRQLLGEDGAIQRARIGAYAWCEADGAVVLVRIAAGYPEWVPFARLDSLDLVPLASWTRGQVGR
jgi:hypothetical protein